MKKQHAIILILVICSFLFSGCLSTGLFMSANTTEVKLSSNNYKIVETNITGEAKSGYILGMSFSAGAATSTFALARVSGSESLYADALESLWANYEETHGSVQGKKLALVNVRYDSDVLNLFLYTEAKITIRADIVEFF